jgi:hypothetical protein
MVRIIAVIALAIASSAFLGGRDAAAGTQREPNAAANVADVNAQLKELKNQVAELQAKLGDRPNPRIVAAGTATWTRPEVLANRTSVRVELPADMAAHIGKDYIVILTNRFPQAGYPYLATYWAPAQNGFDVSLVEPTIPTGGNVSYASANKTYLVDWIVVTK